MSVSPSPRVRRTGTVIRRRRRKRYIGRRISRLLLYTAVVAVALWIGSAFVCGILRPLRLVSVEKREMARIVSDYKALKKQNQALERQLRYLKTPEGIAQEARKQGFVKPGEISLVLPDEETSAPSDR